jgi:glycosyltransferase involved in cell wall biosynthesis
MESLKINFIMYSMGRTGGTRVLLNFANELFRLGHEVSISTANYDRWFNLEKGIKVYSPRFAKVSLYKHYGIELVNRKIGHSNLQEEINFLKKLSRIVPNSDVNIATFSPTAYIAFFKSPLSVPFYHMQHMETLMTNDAEIRNLIRSTYFLPIPKVANSKWLQDRVLKLTGEKVDVVNPAIEHEIFYPRENINTNSNNINIVALGKGGWKNPNLIYEAVKEVRSMKITDKSIVLHFFGHKVPQGILIDNKETVFHYDISDDDLATLYSSSDIQITASTAESFPLPPLEAMACGTSVITTPYGVEDYAIDGVNSIIVQPNSKQELKSAIIKLIEDEDLRSKLSKNGILTANRYKYKDQAKLYEKILKKNLNLYRENIKDVSSDFSKFGVPL